ncbi:MAG TPA: class I SAM-dependent methyltransferase [Microvirga sp.]|jgi:hypothetical protein|nr:class I SAM-dependent methyltransferase [Microvirga sp.]
MTRLDSVIRRLTAQRTVIDWAAEWARSQPGLVLELGLGNGRTYDHLRDRLPGRDIYVFERQPAAHPSCMPPDSHLLVGDIFETLPAFRHRFGHGAAVLIHADIGTGDQEENRRLAARLSPLIAPLLRASGLMLADRDFALEGCRDVTAETGIDPGRYFAYRREV